MKLPKTFGGGVLGTCVEPPSSPWPPRELAGRIPKEDM